MLDDYLLDFWEKELSLSEEEEVLSLEIFGRPYMYTLTEREFMQLSPEDQEKAMEEVIETGREIRSYMKSVIVEAESFEANKDYMNAEAYFVYCLEIGRELSINKDGLFITRMVGISCEKDGLNGLVNLYTETGDNSKLQMAYEQLWEIEQEVEEMRRTAKATETQS